MDLDLTRLAFGGSAPAPGPGVCPRCRGPRGAGRIECWCCAEVGQQLNQAARQGPDCIPLSVARTGDPLHRTLRQYKDAPSASARHHFTGVLAAHLRRRVHDLGLWPGVDAVSVVPSTVRGLGRVQVAPFAVVLERSGLWPAAARVVCGAVRHGSAHLCAHADAFVPPGEVAGRSVLVLDDVWVTGARARSAAAALIGAGATVPAVVVAARLVDVDASATNLGWWQQTQATG